MSLRDGLYRLRKAAASRGRLHLANLGYRIARDVTRNPAARRLHRRHGSRPSSAVGQRIVDDLARHGLATVTWDELFGGDPSWEEVKRLGDAFFAADDTRRRIERGRDGAGKGYLVRRMPDVAEVDLVDPWLRLGVDPRLLGPVNDYLGLCARLAYFDLWYTLPSPPDAAPVASQRWHRDPEDERMLKVFLYFSDVDDEAGPLEYVRYSRLGDRHQDVWHLPLPSLLRVKGTAEESYPPQDLIDARVPPEDRVLATGPAGTLVLCDTSGFHRGGRGSKPRLLAKWEYQTPASRWPPRFAVRAGDSTGLTVPGRFAVGLPVP